MRLDNGIISLTEENEVFVFGSNGEGMHNGGAAKYALDNYGAIYGQAVGPQGKSYAIDTMNGLTNIFLQIIYLEEYALENQDKVFILTPIGCGIAGYTPNKIAPLFEDFPSNVILPKEFKDVLCKEKI